MAKGGRRKSAVREDRNAPLGLEAQLWAAADALRNNVDAAVYKHVVLIEVALVMSGLATHIADGQHLKAAA